ncbi:MAG TPA: hypothetical protein VFS52_17615 [Steroidobacteraceae bacterium]|jgi:lysophospholipase L1-like esterase|nr:hypothetical protein [Steroidobacteraceae bacterium]
MTARRFILRVSAFVAGIVGMLVLLELVLRIVPVSEGIYAADPSRAWPLHRLVTNSTYTYSSGWNAHNLHRGRVNNFGYVSPDDYRPGESGIVVIGDSYIESLMNDYEETLQGRLGDLLDHPQKVMNFGTSGADLPHYLGTARLVGEHFRPTWAVILISRNDYQGGFSADTGYFRWAPERDPPIEIVPEVKRSPLVKFVRELALVRYVRGNLKVRVRDLVHWRRAVDPKPDTTCTPHPLSTRDKSLTARFVDELPKALDLPPSRVILVFDTDRRAIYAGAPASAQECPSLDDQARERIMQLAVSRGMLILDTADTFRSYYVATRQRVDFTPEDYHWNPIGHQLVAREVAAIINAFGSENGRRHTLVPRTDPEGRVAAASGNGQPRSEREGRVPHEEPAPRAETPVEPSAPELGRLPVSPQVGAGPL